MKTKFSLALADATRIAEAAEAEASKNEWSVVIAVVDDGGHLLFLKRLDGTQAASSDIAVHKARTAVLFKRPTIALEEVIASGRIAMLSLPGVTRVEGGVPIVYRGDIVGAIGVSGAQSFQDGIVAQAGAESRQNHVRLVATTFGALQSVEVLRSAFWLELRGNSVSLRARPKLPPQL
jgi:uncharacterized protein GlcG (DUF336 family)